MANPTPIVITDPNGKALTITGATSSSGTPQAPTPCVLTDTNGNPLVLGSGSIEALTPSGNGTYAATGQVGLTTAPSGDVLTADGSGNVKDSGTLLSSLAPLANTALTGTTTAQKLNASRTVTTGINALGNVTGATAVDLSLGNVVSMTLTGNVTISLSNAVASAGQEVTFIVTQNGTGGNVITWPTTVPAGIAPYASLAAGSISVFKALVDGSGALNFSGNGAVVVFRQTVTGLSNTNTASETIYQPPALGKYRIGVCITVTTADSNNPLYTCNVDYADGNAGGSTSKNLNTTVQGEVASVIGQLHALSTSSKKVGWQLNYVSGTIATVQLQADFVVEYLGN